MFGGLGIGLFVDYLELLVEKNENVEIYFVFEEFEVVVWEIYVENLN